MHYLTQICKVTIAVFLTAVVAVLFSTLTGCRGYSAEEKEVRWVPVPQDTIPEVAIDSLSMDSVAVKEIVVAKKTTKPAKKAKKSTKKKQSASKYKDTHPDEPGDSNGQYNKSEEFNLGAVELTIITPDMEMQITRNLE